MAFGLQVLDPAGNVIVDSNTDIGRILGSFSTGTSNGSFSPALSGVIYSELFTIVVPKGDIYAPQFTVTSTTISWDFRTLYAPYRTDCFVFYGVK